VAGRGEREGRRRGRRTPLVGRHPILDGPPTRKPRSAGLLALVAVLAVVFLVWGISGGDPGTATRSDTGYVDTGRTDGAGGLPVVALSGLPVEAARTAALIDAGGPFPGERDGVVFSNFEGLLPDADSGYYREYTVTTPGVDGRGARRLVEGGDGELFWTSDHYASFAAVAR